MMIGLGAEHILNATRKSLTRTNGSTPLIVEDETVTISGNDYHKRVVSLASYLSGDSNNGANFRDFGLFTIATLPGTAAGISGIMFNRYVAASNYAKDISNQLDVITTVRF